MKLFSPAKINLFLQITGKRPDGYHDIVTLMCCIGIYDIVSLNFGAEKTAVSCSDPTVPKDSTNLAHRSARLFFKTLDIDESVNISIKKNIPIAGGLGGGSSNAAAVLLGLNRHYGYPFTRDELRTMGLKIGADVPFFIFQKPALASGIGEKLEAYEGLPLFHVVLIYPGFAVSTETTYKNLNLGLTKCKKKLKGFSFNKQYFNAAYHLCNDLESVTASKYPDIGEAKAELMRHGALGALMSGSGPSVFGLFSDPHTAKGANHALSKASKWQVFLADVIV